MDLFCYCEQPSSRTFSVLTAAFLRVMRGRAPRYERNFLDTSGVTRAKSLSPGIGSFVSVLYQFAREVLPNPPLSTCLCPR